MHDVVEIESFVLSVAWAAPRRAQEHNIGDQLFSQLEKVANDKLYSIFDSVHSGVVTGEFDLFWIYVDRENCGKKSFSLSIIFIVTLKKKKKICGSVRFAESYRKLPRSHVKANWIELPPAPQKPSTIVSHRHLSAMWAAIFSGVTENQLSEEQQKTQCFQSWQIRYYR